MVKLEDNDTRFVWKLGIRSLWEEDGLELNTFISGTNDQISWSISGPMYVGENLAVDVNYAYGKQDKKNMTPVYQA